MKIKSTKNIIKQIEGTNTFEVKTTGKRKDLEREVKGTLELYGVVFDDNGDLKSCSYKIKKIMNLINGLVGNTLDQDLLRELVLKNISKQWDSYNNLRKELEFKYILDMSDIEIITKDDIEGNRGLKAIINLKEDKDGMLFVGKEIESNIFDREDNRIIKISNYKY